MTETVRGGPVPFLLRGFLRLLVLVTPLFVFFAALGSDNRRVTWVDTHTTFSAEPSPSLGGDPRPGTQIQGETQVRYVVDHASVGLWLINLLPAFLLAVAVSAVALLLLRTMRETYAGRPFSEHGVRRLRLVAAVVGSGAIVVPLLNSVSSHAIVARVLPDPGTRDRRPMGRRRCHHPLDGGGSARPRCRSRRSTSAYDWPTTSTGWSRECPSRSHTGSSAGSTSCWPSATSRSPHWPSRSA